MKIKRCPNCKSHKITLHIGGTIGTYICKECGYIGSLIIEEERD